MRFGSVCSGIEAASVAWEPLGWQAAWFSEIEPFPCRVLAARFPGVPNLGDMTALEDRILAGEVESPDLLVGGTPCQAFSVAGLRGSLSDARGNLALVFVRLANAIDRARAAAGKPPAWIVWENVPGVLSTKDNAFGYLLGGLVGSDSAIAPKSGWTDAGVVSGPRRVAAWRILDAQYFGLAQRRRRVFVLARGGAGAWACADALLPLGPRGEGDSEPRRTAREGAAGCAPRSLAIRGREGGCSVELGEPGVANCLRSSDGGRCGEGAGAVLLPDIARCLTTGEGGRLDGETCTFVPELAGTLGAHRSVRNDLDSSGAYIPELAGTLKASGFDASEAGTTDRGVRVVDRWCVRRLLPVECERLQGFPDNWTDIDGAADGPRYRALGNSMAVPVMRWIGRQIARVSK